MNNTHRHTPTETRSDHRVAAETWLAVVQTYNHCAAALTERAAKQGLTLLQHEILINLSRAPLSTQQELANRCFSARSGISMLIAAFEKEGVLTRHRDAADARIRRLELTEKGRAMAEQAEADQSEIVSVMTADFTQDDLNKLKQQMHQVSAALIALPTR